MIKFILIVLFIVFVLSIIDPIKAMYVCSLIISGVYIVVSKVLMFVLELGMKVR